MYSIKVSIKASIKVSIIVSIRVSTASAQSHHITHENPKKERRKQLHHIVHNCLGAKKNPPHTQNYLPTRLIGVLDLPAPCPAKPVKTLWTGLIGSRVDELPLPEPELLPLPALPLRLFRCGAYAANGFDDSAATGGGTGPSSSASVKPLMFDSIELERPRLSRYSDPGVPPLPPECGAPPIAAGKWKAGKAPPSALVPGSAPSGVVGTECCCCCCCACWNRTSRCWVVWAS